MNKITSKGAIILFTTLKDFCKSPIKVINLSENYLDDDCMISFGEFLQECQTVEDIRFNNKFEDLNKISDSGIKILAPYLIGTPLKVIDLSGNRKISNTSASLLKEIIPKCCLKEINLERTLVTKNEISMINTYLKLLSEEREIPIFSATKSAAKSDY